MVKKIWIDADSCPEKIRPIIIKGSIRTNSIAYFVANRKIPVQESKNVKMIIITDGDTDSYIKKKVNPRELVITRDIPLAAELLQKNAVVINDRGLTFTNENITEKLSLRNFSYILRQDGIYKPEYKKLTSKEVGLFANEFDKALNRFYTFQT